VRIKTCIRELGEHVAVTCLRFAFDTFPTGRYSKPTNRVQAGAARSIAYLERQTAGVLVLRPFIQRKTAEVPAADDARLYD
jgi:hypothetical protein